MRRHVTTILAATAFATLTATAASANPLGDFLGAVFGQRPQQASYNSGASSYAYAPEYYGREVGGRIPRETVYYSGSYAPGTVVVSTSERRLYFVLPGHKAIKYG